MKFTIKDRVSGEYLRQYEFDKYRDAEQMTLKLQKAARDNGKTVKDVEYMPVEIKDAVKESFNVDSAVNAILAGKNILAVLEADAKKVKEEKPIKFHGYTIVKHPDVDDLFLVNDKKGNTVCTAKSVKEIEDKWNEKTDATFTAKQIAKAKYNDAWIANCFDAQGGHIDWEKFNKK